MMRSRTMRLKSPSPKENNIKPQGKELSIYIPKTNTKILLTS